jgi:hypothetical protein
MSAAQPPRADGSFASPATYQNGTPDFEARAEALRPLYERAHASGLVSDKAKLEALAATRSFLHHANAHEKGFREAAKERGIRRGRLETRVLRYIFRVETIDGRTSVNRWADALAWLADHCDATVPDTVAVETAINVGGRLTKIAEIEHKRRQAANAASVALRSAPTFYDEMATELDECEPFADDEILEPNTLAVFLKHVTPNGVAEEYGPIRVESLIRAAIRALPRCPT